MEVIRPWGSDAIEREFRTLSGALCTLPRALSAEQSRVRLSASLGVDAHQIHFARSKELTDRAFDACESCSLLVALKFLVRCGGCASPLRCSCRRGARLCQCVPSRHRTRELCDSCEGLKSPDRISPEDPGKVDF